MIEKVLKGFERKDNVLEPQNHRQWQKLCFVVRMEVIKYKLCSSPLDSFKKNYVLMYRGGLQATEHYIKQDLIKMRYSNFLTETV